MINFILKFKINLNFSHLKNGLLSLFLVIGFSENVLGQSSSTICGSDVVNRSDINAELGLLTCIQKATAKGFKVIELVSGRYYIGGVLNLGSIGGVKIKTLGIDQNAPGCLQSGSKSCATFYAKKDNPGPAILSSNGAQSLILDHIVIDGNNASRRLRFTNSSFANIGRGPMAFNGMIHNCSYCEFHGFASIRAAQGTGLEFSGTHAIFSNVLFKKNGWGISSYDKGWADGLTALSAPYIKIVDSKFIDNSDVNLILGHAPFAIIQRNLIESIKNFAFAGLMLDNFNGSQGGNFDYSNISDNIINCYEGMCGVGFDIGPNLWYGSGPISGYAAIANRNFIIGAKQGILSVGSNGFNVIENSVITNGAYGLDNYRRCIANPISVKEGDSINVSQNNYGIFPYQLKGCSVETLHSLLIHLPGVNYTIASLYRQILGRNPDLEGGQAWSRYLANNGKLQVARNSFASSPEARFKLNNLYLEILGREIDANGLATFTSHLASGRLSFDQIRVTLEMSNEALARE